MIIGRLRKSLRAEYLKEFFSKLALSYGEVYNLCSQGCSHGSHNNVRSYALWRRQCRRAGISYSSAREAPKPHQWKRLRKQPLLAEKPVHAEAKWSTELRQGMLFISLFIIISLFIHVYTTL